MQAKKSESIAENNQNKRIKSVWFLAFYDLSDDL